jgi:predicted molibdopterin-dependent oxidoreductase YjgC
MNYQTVATLCPYCGCGCGLLLEVLDGQVMGVLPQVDHPINGGGLCIKGWSAHEFIHSPERLKKPLLRKEGELQEVSWEEALEFAVFHLGRIRKESPPGSFAGLASAKCTNEENYLFQKWVRAGMGTHNVDHCARL